MLKEESRPSSMLTKLTTPVRSAQEPPWAGAAKRVPRRVGRSHRERDPSSAFGLFVGATPEPRGRLRAATVSSSGHGVVGPDAGGRSLRR